MLQSFAEAGLKSFAEAGLQKWRCALFCCRACLEQSRHMLHKQVAVSILYLHTGPSLGLTSRNDLQGWPTLGGPDWADFWPTLGRSWAHLEQTFRQVGFGSTLGQLWADFKPTLGRLWVEF